MKILLYLDPAPVRGGIEIFAERQAGRLRAAGHEVAIANRPDPAALARMRDAGRERSRLYSWDRAAAAVASAYGDAAGEGGRA